MADLCEDMMSTQWDYITSGQALWFNEHGGYNLGLPNVTSITYKDNLLFPNYTKNDIKISKWNGGKHYYAKIGEIEVKEVVNGEVVMKWDTYDEAYQKALNYCSQNNDLM